MEIVLFLQACDFNIEEAKKTLVNNYKMRTKSPLFKDRSVDKDIILKSRQSVSLFVLPETNDDGCVVAGGLLFDTDISKYQPQGYFEEAVMLLETYQLEHGTTPGVMVIIDVKGTSLRHLLKIPLNLTKAVLNFTQEALTLKVKGLHFVNTRGSIIDTIMTVIRPFIKEALLEKIHFHQGYDTLKDFMNVKILPEEYGGQAGKVKRISDESIQRLNSYKKYFTLDEYKKIDESKNPHAKSRYFGWF